MIKGFLQYWLGINQNDRELEEISNRLEDLENKVEDSENIKEDLEDLKHTFYDSRPVTSDLTKTERKLVEIFMSSEEWLDKKDLSEKMDITRNYAGTLISEISKNMDIQSKKIGSNNKKAYKLSESEKQRIEQGY